MEEVETKDSKPTSAYGLFVKLYCKRKLKPTKKCSVLEEAAKSWLLLSKMEKQVFIDKYEEYHKKELQYIADCLKNTEPYLKRKRLKDMQFYDKSFRSELLEQTKTEEVPNSNVHSAETPKPEEDIQEYSMPAEVITEDTDTNSAQLNLPPNRGVLAEPTPPSVKTAMELYNMVNTGSTDWATVPNTQKTRYQRIVLNLKKDYIKKYKTYLESLSSTELYDHYCNKIDCET